ncbi:MAG TPA: biotin carboxylase N-terminal domain-containing protein [Saprospiraceae bacterium]|nr:biotin carboxylase N-terminal domain-containing protein [Saprospiraceae bacterium]HNT18922.1 biotin carboxylase N-terminal domain-containing protein [Saprospiraceae bacterium]
MPKLLVANRGEIAIRIFRTARKKGWKCVAVYSEADRHSLHLAHADEAYCIGPAPAKDSYLNIPSILEAAKKSGAGFIHPGYGFLSEKSEFVSAVESAGLVFIGPGVEAMQKLGSKIAAKQIAEQLGIPLVPGYHRPIRDDGEGIAMARHIGVPLMIKAAAGGGGKGMRVVKDLSQIVEAISRARAESKASFADDSIFLEKYIENPRHVEVQIMADLSGRCIAFPERECSLQRRHQKLMEESPCVFISSTTREALRRDAVRLAQACGYTNTGTVEFIVDAEENYYFLEMNTRLQVEHTVTEMLTGLDLVDLQLDIALGRSLPFTQEEIRSVGHAMQWRIYAEDPAQGFMPSTGQITKYLAPTLPQIRIDSGYGQGSEVEVYYDPMIAKLIASDQDRFSCMERLKEALQQFIIEGIETSIPFGIRVLEHPAVLAGDLSTGFLDQHLNEILYPPDLEDKYLAAAAAAYHYYRTQSGQLKLPNHE